MGAANEFEYEVRSDGSVIITHHGRKATVLRGARAEDFRGDTRADPQGAMARWAGNYKHRNERTAKQHPRNRG